MLNFIASVHIWRDADVKRAEEDWLFIQPDKTKDKLALFNYWSEKKRSGISDDATTAKLILDYDGGAKRADIEKRFERLDYLIYNSTGNSPEVDKFRIILSLKQPIIASDLRYYRNDKRFMQLFDGVDKSSFAIGRFFVRPSKYDKTRQLVTIDHNVGDPFDFYSEFEHRAHLEAWDKLLDTMRAQRQPTNITRREDIFDKWADEHYPVGTHYCDVCAFCLRAHSCGLDVYEAKLKFAERYAGGSKWEPNFVKFFNSIR